MQNNLIFSTVKAFPHCYQVNDCSSKILVIEGGVYFLRHCHPFSNKKFLLVDGGKYFFLYKKYCPPFTNKNIFSTKGGTYFSVGTIQRGKIHPLRRSGGFGGSPPIRGGDIHPLQQR